MNMNKTTPQQFQVKLGEYGVKCFSNHVRRPSIGCFVKKIYTIVLLLTQILLVKCQKGY